MQHPASGAFIGHYIGPASGRSGGTINVYAPFMRNDAMFIGYSQSMYLMVVEP